MSLGGSVAKVSRRECREGLWEGMLLSKCCEGLWEEMLLSECCEGLREEMLVSECCEGLWDKMLQRSLGGAVVEGLRMEGWLKVFGRE